ncbi:MAG TPA: FlgD immunoglobulin-like domain containing protein, partial [Candidatus Eisenbacteria bacterium]
MRDGKALILSLALLLASSGPALARPIDRLSEYRPELSDPSIEAATSQSPGLSSHIFGDTVSYGGTYWAPDSLRWEAIRDSHWSFDTGVGSSINTGANPNKPVGYHQQMEGWFGLDQTLSPLPYFRRSSTCAISGSFSYWAGVTVPEATALCFAAGQGYGNSWTLTIAKSFAYAGAGNIAFSFQYAVEAEPGFDYAYAMIDTTGNGSQDDLILWTQDGTAAGTASITLNPGQDMRSTAGNYTVKFVAASDGGYADEDGAYATTCGLLAVDNVTVGADVSDFETGDNGWAQMIPTTGIGDFTNLAYTPDVEAPPTFCPCGVQDSILVFFDPNDGHPIDQDNIAVSPWIDLLAGGDVGKPGKLLLHDVVAIMPLTNYIFTQYRVRYYPEVCAATGLLYRTPWKDQNVVFYWGEQPICNPANAPRLRDYSAVFSPGAQQAQLAFGMISLCRTSPFGPLCTGVTNQTPYYDNISLGVYGNATVPVVNTTTFDRFQDNFAADGTLHPAAPGRFDQNRIKGASTPSTGTILGDTLNARGNGGNTEVRLVFRVRTGPFVNGATLASYVARWTSEPTLGARYGGNWYSARMDTAEQGGVPATSPFTWMSTFHEADPGFIGTDRAADPNDPNRLANDIIPDHLFTPGSRLDYFVAARYRPPDPRNPGGTDWSTDPDTAGSRFREAEILPSSFAADATWNCLLYVDHHDDRDQDQQYLEEAGLQQSLGAGSTNAENTRYDRFDNQNPSAAQLSFGRPNGTNYGCSQIQVNFYKSITWQAASMTSGAVTAQDVAILSPWLLLRASANNAFWGSGDGIVQSMHATGGSTRAFMNNTLGVLQNCTGIRLAACGGAGIDTTYCMPLSPVADAWFASSVIPHGRGNGCPELRAFDRLDRNASAASSKGQLNYVRLVPGTGGVPTDIGFASVANLTTSSSIYRSVLDGLGVGSLRTNSGGFGTGCDDVSASLARTDDILDWFEAPLRCRYPGLVGTPDPPATPYAPGFRLSLGPAWPNPMTTTTRLQFTNAVPQADVRLTIFDVTGRVVRTLHKGEAAVGTHELAWDRTNDEGRPVAGGIYFYRLA